MATLGAAKKGQGRRPVAVSKGCVPAYQWVRVVGGFTAHQFAEKRLPTIEEINAVAPDTRSFCCISMTEPC
jgi:predicted amidohydrolase YtcJ